MEKLLNCPKCGFNEFKPYISCTDFTVSKELFEIVSCSKCQFKFTNPRPDAIEIGRYYESQDYISHSDTKKGLFNKIYHYVRGIAIRNKINLIIDLQTKNKSILDIGCGTGTFLAEIQKYGWKITGIEPNKLARETAEKHYSLPVYDEEKISEIPENSFSIITLWHVLEHVHNLKQRITEIYNLLEKDGFAIIAVPNHTSWDADYYKSFWAAYDAPRHLYHFSPSSIKELFKESKMFHVKSLPMKFDSYYVSLLSEKYKGNSLGPLNALLSGWKSNRKAGKNSEKYSSVIYIFQKK
jgi:SAM-dependent methyltransferase